MLHRRHIQTPKRQRTDQSTQLYGNITPATTTNSTESAACIIGHVTYGINVVTQQQTLAYIGRTTAGYLATDPDGDCAVVSSIQTQLSNSQLFRRRRDADAVKRTALANCSRVRRLLQQAIIANTEDVQGSDDSFPESSLTK